MGIIESFNKEQLYKLYLAQVNSMCFNNSFITFNEYLENCKPKKVEKKNKSQIFNDSIKTLEKLQLGGD
ncbi:MAG: hypothetical protein E6902_13450 [Paeniclostridium sordellii]|nr:hypothetical protein [Paeniclostridium sordellii]